MKEAFSDNYTNLYKAVFELYHLPENKAKLLFHGWHHIKFVHDKSIEFAKELGADIELVASAALVHDLNYIFTDQLEPEAAKDQITIYVEHAGYSGEISSQINQIIENAHIAYRRTRTITNETKALADADTLFKALPIVPILFASRYLSQENFSVEQLAIKVVSEQKPLLDEGIYFYSDSAKKKYIAWASTNVTLWENILQALHDKAVVELLQNAHDLGVL